MQHIKEIIKIKVKREIVGKELVCKRCKGDAVVILEEQRLMVHCYTCQDHSYLKEYN